MKMKLNSLEFDKPLNLTSRIKKNYPFKRSLNSFRNLKEEEITCPFKRNNKLTSLTIIETIENKLPQLNQKLDENKEFDNHSEAKNQNILENHCLLEISQKKINLDSSIYKKINQEDFPTFQSEENKSCLLAQSNKVKINIPKPFRVKSNLEKLCNKFNFKKANNRLNINYSLERKDLSIPQQIFIKKTNRTYLENITIYEIADEQFSNNSHNIYSINPTSAKTVYRNRQNLENTMLKFQIEYYEKIDMLLKLSKATNILQQNIYKIKSQIYIAQKELKSYTEENYQLKCFFLKTLFRFEE